MVVVGLDLKPGDFAGVVRRPEIVAGSIAGQWLLLPVIAWTLVALLPLPIEIAAGVVLLAACPAGAISNYYALIARADVALSMTLTSISIAIAMLKMPLITTIGFRFILNDAAHVTVPVLPMILQLFAFLLLPTVLGMWLRSRWPDAATRHMTRARRVGDAAIFATFLAVMVGLRSFVFEHLGWAVSVSVVWVLLAAGIGFAVAAMMRTDRGQRYTVAIEYSCRNNAIMALVGLVVLDRPELAAFALIVFLVQVPIVLGGVFLTRSKPAES